MSHNVKLECFKLLNTTMVYSNMNLYDQSVIRSRIDRPFRYVRALTYVRGRKYDRTWNDVFTSVYILRWGIHFENVINII